MEINKENYEMIDMAPLLGVGTGMVILIAYVNKMYRKRIKSTKKIIEDNKRIFFISKEGEYDKQREEQKYFNSINTLTPQEPMSKQFEHLLKGDGKYSLADVLAGVFAPPLQKIPNPLNFIEISLEKSGPFKYSYYPSNNKYLSKSRGLCLLMNDSNLESDHLDNYYPEWNSATYKKNIQTNKPITPTYNFNMIVSRRGCFGNVWKNFRNIEEVYKKIQLENHFLQQKNDRNEEDRKNLISNHQNQINEISLKFQQEKESYLQQLKTVQLYLDGERNLRIEKEKEIEIYNMEIQKLNQKIKQYELLSSYTNSQKLNGSGSSSNGFLSSHN